MSQQEMQYPLFNNMTDKYRALPYGKRLRGCPHARRQKIKRVKTGNRICPKAWA